MLVPVGAASKQGVSAAAVRGEGATKASADGIQCVWYITFVAVGARRIVSACSGAVAGASFDRCCDRWLSC